MIMRNRDACFRIQERVRWSDVDASGFILWSAYTRLVEMAETELFRAPCFLLIDDEKNIQRAEYGLPAVGWRRRNAMRSAVSRRR